MRRSAWIVGVLLGPFGLTGCVERSYVIESQPPGAAVFVNGQRLPGDAPADGRFVYYGNYDLTLVADGHETLKVRERLRAPWYEYPPLDFIAENLVPWTIKDKHVLGPYQLQPLQAPNTAEDVRRAVELQDRAKQIGTPAPVAPPPDNPQ